MTEREDINLNSEILSPPNQSEGTTFMLPKVKASTLTLGILGLAAIYRLLWLLLVTQEFHHLAPLSAVQIDFVANCVLVLLIGGLLISRPRLTGVLYFTALIITLDSIILIFSEVSTLFLIMAPILAFTAIFGTILFLQRVLLPRNRGRPAQEAMVHTSFVLAYATSLIVAAMVAVADSGILPTFGEYEEIISEGMKFASNTAYLVALALVSIKFSQNFTNKLEKVVLLITSLVIGIGFAFGMGSRDLFSLIARQIFFRSVSLEIPQISDAEILFLAGAAVTHIFLLLSLLLAFLRRYLSREVVGLLLILGLSGPEAGIPVLLFSRLFALARIHGLIREGLIASVTKRSMQ